MIIKFIKTSFINRIFILIMTNKEKYIQFLCSTTENIPIFMQDWWLNIATNNSWDVLLIEKNDEIIAAMPVFIRKRYCFLSIVPPNLTPRNGLYIKREDNCNLYSFYERENNIMEDLANQINKRHLSLFVYSFFPEIKSHLGFYWHGFNATIHYTYKVDVSDIDKTFLSFHKKRRQYIRDAQRNVSSIITKDYDIEYLYSLWQKIFKRQNIQTPVSFKMFSTLVKESEKRNQGKMFVAKDKDKNVLAFLFIVWDKETCYNLISARNEEKDCFHTESLLIYSAMCFINSIGLKDYDMEGSMIKGVERYFRSFSAKQTPYIVIEKYYSKIYKFLRKIKHN